MKFSIPVVYTTVGWIEIDAVDLEDAKRQAVRMNEDGVEYNLIKDSSNESECMVDEITPIG